MCTEGTLIWPSLLRSLWKFSRISSWQNCCLLCMCTQSHSTLYNPMDSSLPGFSVPANSPGKNTEVGCHFLLQGIFLSQGSNPCLLHLLHWQADSLQWHHLSISYISMLLDIRICQTNVKWWAWKQHLSMDKSALGRGKSKYKCPEVGPAWHVTSES